MDNNLQQILDIDSNNRFIEYIVGRVQRDDYRGAHISQHNRYDLHFVLKFLKIINSIVNTSLFEIPRGDYSDKGEKDYDISYYPNFKQIIDKINSSLGKGTYNSVKKTFFVDFHKMGLIKRYDKNRAPTDPYRKQTIYYASLTDEAIRLLKTASIKEQDKIFKHALYKLFQNLSNELTNTLCNSKYINDAISIYEFAFIFTDNKLNSYKKIYLLDEYRKLNKSQKNNFTDLIKKYANPDRYIGSKTQKRDFHNWINESQQILSLLKQTNYFQIDEKNKNITLNISNCNFKMKPHIQTLINTAIKNLITTGILPDEKYNIALSNSKNKAHGDYASNIAMITCSKAKMKPIDMANLIISNIPKSDNISKIEVAGAGFINFFATAENNNNVIKQILAKGKDFGLVKIGNNQNILVEFVSANPTGPLHVGHGRGAAYGSSVANLLKAIGYSVDCEYYVNDSGRQMDILTISVYLRYLELLNITIILPDNAYKGDYIYDIAKKVQSIYQDKWQCDFTKITQNISNNLNDDKEKYMDAIIANCKSILAQDYNTIFSLSIKYILADIKQELLEFRVNFDAWFSEQSLMQSGLLAKTIAKLKQNKVIYEKNGALWFKTTDFGDKKDRVVVRDNNNSTYFASDIAYHLEKFTRRMPTYSKNPKYYDKIINIWGADHHGYIARTIASIKALGYDSDKLEILLVQFVNLYRGKIKANMSTRSGEFIPLKELITEVGCDAARFFYILRKSEQHMDFDLELAKSKSNDNPVFYIQYAHARICRVLAKHNFVLNNVKANLSLLVAPQEEILINVLNRYCDTIISSAKSYEPHQLAYYLKDLATALHSYYANCKFIGDDKELTTARLTLISAVKQVIKNALNMLGVNAPESM